MPVGRIHFGHTLAADVGIGPVTRVAEDVFVGVPMDTRRTRAYGGSTLAQSLLAAMNFLGVDCRPRSVAASLLKAADGSIPVEFHIDVANVRRTIASLRITARQGESDVGLVQASMDLTSVPPAKEASSVDSLKDEVPDVAQAAVDWEGIEDPYRERFLRFEGRHAWDIRFASRPPVGPGSSATSNTLWVRPLISGSVPAWTNELFITHASDFYVPGVAAASQGGFLSDEWMATTVTHSVWFLGWSPPGSWMRIDQNVIGHEGDRVLVEETISNAGGQVMGKAVQEAVVRRREIE